jgi:hypothetical protein
MCGISVILALREHTKKADRPSFLAGLTGLFSYNIDTPPPGPSSYLRLDGLRSNIQHDNVSLALDASLDKINHRGPDSHGKWISDDHRVGMLATPLSNHCKHISNEFFQVSAMLACPSMTSRPPARSHSTHPTARSTL